MKKGKMDMKKRNKLWAAVVIMVAVLLCICCIACAEGWTDITPKGDGVQRVNTAFDWTSLFQAVLGLAVTAIGALLTWAWKMHIKPWLDERNLTDAARVAVNAVEAILGRGNGEEKLELALRKLEDKGFNINVECVKDAVIAAWKELDLQMVQAGIKAAKEEE